MGWHITHVDSRYFSMHYIKMTLSAPTQHYAYVTETAHRRFYKTEHAPTRSAVVGLLGCALGIPRGDKRLEDMNRSISAVWREAPVMCGEKTCEISVICDDQTVTPGKGEAFLTADGSDEKSSPIQKTIEYLCDARFEVFVGADDEALAGFYHALCDPEWALYCGKRKCPPDEMIPEETMRFYDKEELPDDVYDCL